MNTKKIPNPRTPTSVRADIVTAILALGARQRARMIAGHHLYNKVDLRAWLDVAAERYLAAELEAERAASSDAQLPVPKPAMPDPPSPAAQQQAAPELPAAVDEPKIAAPPAPKSPWEGKGQDDEDQEDDQDDQDQEDDQDDQDQERTEEFEGVTIRVGVHRERGDYVHWRPRSEMLAEGRELRVPDPAIHNPHLLRERQKPSAMGYKRAEKLIVQVREARARGEDPAPLWAQWMPPAARKAA